MGLPTDWQPKSWNDQSCGGQDELTSAHVSPFGAGLTVIVGARAAPNSASGLCRRLAPRFHRIQHSKPLSRNAGYLLSLV